jgi:2-iminoacetate synthase
MGDFHLDPEALDALLSRAHGRSSGRLEPIVTRAREGGGLTVEEIATLWLASDLDAESMYQLACETRRGHAPQLETFSPLYMTNTCDAECRMCGMRRDNQALRRETAEIAGVEAQLQLLSRRGMRAVALLTGEYRPANRPWAMRYVNQALHATQQLGFQHVLINVGSIDAGEFDTLLAGIPRHADGSVQPKLTMSTFQETYAPPVYARFMGTDPDNPRADFGRRVTNFDRAFRAGMRIANPGILIGLNPDLGYELTAFALHVEHLLGLGMEIYLSVPRLRQIAGGRSQGGVSDAAFIRLVSLLSMGLPTCKIVITTRETSAVQHKLAPIVTVISAGSAAVAPYTPTGARFPLETSQFEVIDQRPFEEILSEHRPNRGTIVNFRPPPGEARLGPV